MKENINLPPFYVGQKVVALASGSSGSFNVVKDNIYTVAFCITNMCKKSCKHSCDWDIGLLEFPAKKDTSFCARCDMETRHTGKYYFIASSKYFAPIESTFQSISLTEVLELETPLICVN